jgi:hypothetical protein
MLSAVASLPSFSFGGIKGSEKIKTPTGTQSISILQEKKENYFLDNSLVIQIVINNLVPTNSPTFEVVAGYNPMNRVASSVDGSKSNFVKVVVATGKRLVSFNNDITISFLLQKLNYFFVAVSDAAITIKDAGNNNKNNGKNYQHNQQLNNSECVFLHIITI